MFVSFDPASLKLRRAWQGKRDLKILIFSFNTREKAKTKKTFMYQQRILCSLLINLIKKN